MQETEEPKIDHQRFIIIGSPKTGKSSLRNFLVDRPLRSGKHRDYTEISDSIVKKTQSGVEVELVDIHNLEELKNSEKIQEDVLKDMDGIFLLFAVNDVESFKAVPDWLTLILEQNKRTMVPIILVGNKSDLRQKGEDFISFQSANDYSDILSTWAGIKIPYFDISLKMDKGTQSLANYLDNLKPFKIKYEKNSESDTEKDC